MALDTKTLAELKEKLLGEKARLERELSRFAEPTAQKGDYRTKMEDLGPNEDENATESEMYGDNVALEANLEAQLKDVNDALARMESGTYGKDERNGAEIPLERLQVYPAARTRIDA